MFSTLLLVSFRVPIKYEYLRKKFIHGLHTETPPLTDNPPLTRVGDPAAVSAGTDVLLHWHIVGSRCVSKVSYKADFSK